MCIRDSYVPYPKSLCTSVNHQVCHGIPNDKPLKKGDIVNIDVTVITKDGWLPRFWTTSPPSSNRASPPTKSTGWPMTT